MIDYDKLMGVKYREVPITYLKSWGRWLRTGVWKRTEKVAYIPGFEEAIMKHQNLGSWLSLIEKGEFPG